MDPNQLTVFSPPFPKTRIGKEFDGGYVIVDIPNHYSCLISGGISDDISFEEEFMSKYNVPCYAFDGTINSLPKDSEVQFFKKNIGAYNDATVTNLHDLINRNSNIFIKMDIEGYEIPWLKSLSNEQMNKIDQIAIEFHSPFGHDIFGKFRNHVLVHFHGNNCCGTRFYRGRQIPHIFECTYLHKKYFNEIVPNKFPLPGPLDMRNLPLRAEIDLNYPPFVSGTRIQPINIGAKNGRWSLKY
jgi:hypothetical protein